MSVAARGDTRPCSRDGCEGLMQYGREPERAGSVMDPAAGILGWVCNRTPEHFTTVTAGFTSAPAVERAGRA